MPPAPTPHSRIANLLAHALPLVSKDHPAFELLAEATKVASGLDPYLEQSSSKLIVPQAHSVSEPEVRKVWNDLLKATDDEDWTADFEAGKTQYALNSGMCSGEYEAVLLQLIALTANASNILEIGVFTGTTSLALALLDNVKAIVGLDIEEFLETFDRPFWQRAGVSDKITTMIAPAADSLRKLKADGHPQFDCVFIDADKPSYAQYVELLLELDLLSPNGIILADNTLYKGLPWATWDKPSEDKRNANSNNKSLGEATQGIVDFNEFVRKDPRLVVSVLPVRDGVSVIRRRV